MIDLRVYGEPAQCREQADDLRRVAPEVSDTAGVVRSGCSRARSSWRGGQDAWLFERQATSLAEEADALDAGLRKAARALDTFADELAAVRERMAQAREVALAGGLTVSGDRVLDDEIVLTMGDQVPAQADRVRTEVLALAHQARVKEEAAHEALRATLEEACPAPLSEVLANAGGVVPVEGLAEGGYASMSAHAGLAGGSLVTEWATRHRYGTFYPESLGKHAATNAPGYVRLLRTADEEHWRARLGQGQTYARWARFGKAVPVVGALLSGGTKGYDQWQEDEAKRSEMGTAEQVTRAATMGVFTFGLSLGGASVGGALGGMAGLWSGPGAAVSAFAAGTAGGIGGAELGEEVGEALMEPVGDAAGEVTDSASSFGDAVKFWD